MWRLVASRLQPLLRPIPVSHALVGACHQQFGPRITLYRFGPSKISQGLLWIGNQEQFSRQAQVFSAPRIGCQHLLQQCLGLSIAPHLGVGLCQTGESGN